MRTLYLLLLGCLPLFFSCEMKKDLFGGGRDEDGTGAVLENVGMLDLEVKPEKEADIPGTKGDGEGEILNSKEFAVSILDSVGQMVKRYDTYAELEEAGELLLPAGTYFVQATWGADKNAAFDSPYYAGDTTCVISAKEVAKVVANCSLQNKKIQFKFADNFFDKFRDEHTIVIDNGAGVLSVSSGDSRIAYLKNTGTLRFTLYATTHDNRAHTYSVDLSADTLIQHHNNVYIQLDANAFNPETPDDPSGPDGEEPELPDDPSKPDDPDDPNVPVDPEKPSYPMATPTLKVDVSLIEKDYVIEIPSDFVDSEKPDTGGDDTPGDNEKPGDDDKPGGDEKPAESPKITGTINGKSFDVNTTQTVTSSTSSVVIKLYVPTGLSGLTADVAIGDIKLPVDLLNASSVAEINGILASMGKKLVVPSKGEKGDLKFDISPFLGMLDTNNSFKVTVKDKNGKSDTATIKLIKK